MIVLIKAGGLGKRMDSDIPKVIHTINYNNNKYPMIVHVLNTVLSLKNIKKIFIVVGKYGDIIESTINKHINTDIIEYVYQSEPLGTGHAVQCAIPYIKNYIGDKLLILSADVPLISIKTLINLLDDKNILLVTKTKNPYGYGRIIFDKDRVIDIIEERDCDDKQRMINYVNCGVYQFNVEDVINTIPLINNTNKQNEYYFTDIVKIMSSHGININYHELDEKHQYEIKNINTPTDIENLYKELDKLGIK